MSKRTWRKGDESNVSYDSLAAETYKDRLSKSACRTTKYRDQDLTWLQVAERDASYVKWCSENLDYIGDDFREALAWAGDHYE